MHRCHDRYVLLPRILDWFGQGVQAEILRAVIIRLASAYHASRGTQCLVMNKKIIKIVQGGTAAQGIKHHPLHFERMHHAMFSLDLLCDWDAHQSDIRPGIDNDTALGQ